MAKEGRSFDDMMTEVCEMQKAEVILSLLSQKAQERPNFCFHRLYRYLYHPGLYQWVMARQFTRALPEDRLLMIIDQLRWERYRVGADQQEDQLVAEVIYALLSSIYGTELASIRWKPMLQQEKQLSRMRSFPRDSWVLYGQPSISDEQVQTVFAPRIADGRFLRLVVRLLKQERASKLYQLWIRLFLLQLQERGVLPTTLCTPLCEQQQLLLFLHQASAKVATQWKEALIKLTGETANWQTIDCSRHSFFFAGLELKPSSTSSRGNFRLLIPYKKIRQTLRPYTHQEKPTACHQYLHLPVEQIISRYRQEIWAFEQAYHCTDNYYKRKKQIHYYLRKSLVYTLAKKLQRSPKQIRQQYRQQVQALTQE
jgi:hypothetical protein